VPLIVTPGQLARQAEFYHQLAAMMAAGMPLSQSLEQILNAPPSPSFRQPINRILDGLKQGLTFAESVQQLGHWLPPFDLALIAAGEQSGRLDASCRLLADHYQDRAQLARQILSQLAYPAFLFHAAVFLAGFPAFFLSENHMAALPSFLRDVGSVLGPIYLVTFLLLFACQSRRANIWRSIIERITHPIPILGKARLSLALARLTAGLEALINAGVPMISAWPLAATASGSPALRRAISPWQPHLLAGESPADLLTQTPAFPEFFRNLYRTGEISGTLDDTLKRLHTFYKDDATRKIRALAEWFPRLIYLAIVAIIAVRIVNFWTGYYNHILDIF
jgi:type II secretory pathway component PulF